MKKHSPVNLQVDTKQGRKSPDRLSSTPELPKSFLKNQGKEFLHLYWKVHPHDVGSPLNIKHKPKSATLKRRRDDSGFMGITHPTYSEKENDSFRANAAILTVDACFPIKTTQSGKPSRFKQEHDNAVSMGSINSVKESKFKSKEIASANIIQDVPAFETIDIPREEEQKQEKIFQQEIPQEPNNLPITYTLEILDENVNGNEEEHKDYHSEHDEGIIPGGANDNHVLAPPQLVASNSTTGAPLDGQVNDPHADGTYMNLLKCYIFTFGICIALVGLDLEFWPYHLVFSLLWAFEAFMAYGLIKELQKEELTSLGKKRRITSICELLSLAIFQVVGMLKLEGLDIPLSLGLIPITITGISTCYLIDCGNRQNSKLLSSTLKMLLWIQLLHVSLKVDDPLAWSWQGIFWITWSFLAIVTFYCFGLFMMFLFIFCFEPPNVNRSYQLVGLFWVLFALAGYSGFGFCVGMGLTSKLEDGTKNNLIVGGLIGEIIHSVLLISYTVYERNTIKRFLRHLATVESQSLKPKGPEYKFEKEQQDLPPYMVMFSPSYFSTFGESLKVRDQDKLRSMKRRITQTKISQYKRLPSQGYLKPITIVGELALKKMSSEDSNKDHISPVSSNNDPNNIALIVNNNATPDLSRQGTSSQLPSPPRLDKKRPSNIIVREPMMSRKDPLKSGLQGPSEDCYSAVQIKDDEEEQASPHLDPKHEKLCFSYNDVDFVKQIGYTDFLNEHELNASMRKTKRENLDESKEEKLCLICFDNYPDAVIMNCGHGGICYECARETYKKTQECYLCRAKIEKLLHIAPEKTGKANIGKFGFRKVISCTKLTKLETQAPSSMDHSYTHNLHFVQGM